MTKSKYIAIGLAALLVFAGGAAALPAQAPEHPGEDVTNEQNTDYPSAEAQQEIDGNNNDSSPEDYERDGEKGREESTMKGPPTEMPEQAPSSVSQIHAQIRETLNGSLSGQELGGAISAIVANDGNTTNSQADSPDDQSNMASENGEVAETNAGPPDTMPEQAPDRVSQIRTVLQSWFSGDGDANPGDEVSNTAR